MPPWEILLECEILTLESSGGLMPGWNRKCPLGVPLIVHILTLAGPGPFLRADVGVGRGGSDFRDLVFILSYYLLSPLRIPPVISGQGWLRVLLFFFSFFTFCFLIASFS